MGDMASKPLSIVADENIPFVQTAFSGMGGVTTVPGREIGPDAVREADVLVVRSVTRVDRALLDGSPVKFVASATSGMDHVDSDYLRVHGIPFAGAVGSNANSVAEYTIAALLELARRGGYHLAGKAIGVVGAGNVGSRVAAKAAALGMRVLENDPPLFRETGDPRYVPFDELEGVDFITLHVPLTRGGPDATHHRADRALFKWLDSGNVLVNTSRGAVVDGKALSEALDAAEILGAVLDVWEGEPDIDIELLGKVDLASPHVAGYSHDGKVAGTKMVFDAAREALELDVEWDPSAELEPDDPTPVEIDAAGRDDEDVIREAVAAFYDITADDSRLRETAELDAAERGARFDDLRKNYPKRREFHTRELVVRGAEEALAAKLEGLGFRLAGSE
jgi:erythronate-4-phosphate dehydrogenase